MTAHQIFTLQYVRDIPVEIDLERPGIYEWRIEGSGTYVGKSKRLRRRLREYPNNVRKIMLALPYRASKPTAFRNVHHALYQAHLDGRAITFSVLENCSTNVLNARERYWIALRGTLNG